MIYHYKVHPGESYQKVFERLCKELITAEPVDTGHWQGVEKNTGTREIHNAVIEMPITTTQGSWASYLKPNLPWAESHFQERVGGVPLNPPPSHVDWPYAQAGNREHTHEDGKFSHSYPERLWPKLDEEANWRWGIRFTYGDLGDLVTLLLRYPTTRQAYLPMWFPEDLFAANIGERVPCSLGWHFILRNNRLHCFYPMRSVDLLRYLTDDLYMAGRLTQWIIDQCQKRSPTENSRWHDVQPGILTCFAVSMHIFEQDVRPLEYKMNKGNAIKPRK